MADEQDLREQMEDAFGDADYPISSPMDLEPALPEGIRPEFESGKFSMTDMELSAELSGSDWSDFPYETPKAFVVPTPRSARG